MKKKSVKVVPRGFWTHERKVKAIEVLVKNGFSDLLEVNKLNRKDNLKANNILRKKFKLKITTAMLVGSILSGNKTLGIPKKTLKEFLEENGFGDINQPVKWSEENIFKALSVLAKHPRYQHLMTHRGLAMNIPEANNLISEALGFETTTENLRYAISGPVKGVYRGLGLRKRIVSWMTGINIQQKQVRQIRDINEEIVAIYNSHYAYVLDSAYIRSDLSPEVIKFLEQKLGRAVYVDTSFQGLIDKEYNKPWREYLKGLGLDVDQIKKKKKEHNIKLAVRAIWALYDSKFGADSLMFTVMKQSYEELNELVSTAYTVPVKTAKIIDFVLNGLGEGWYHFLHRQGIPVHEVINDFWGVEKVEDVVQNLLESNVFQGTARWRFYSNNSELNEYLSTVLNAKTTGIDFYRQLEIQAKILNLKNADEVFQYYGVEELEVKMSKGDLQDVIYKLSMNLEFKSLITRTDLHGIALLKKENKRADEFIQKELGINFSLAEIYYQLVLFESKTIKAWKKVLEDCRIL